MEDLKFTDCNDMNVVMGSDDDNGIVYVWNNMSDNRMLVLWTGRRYGFIDVVWINTNTSYVDDVALTQTSKNEARTISVIENDSIRHWSDLPKHLLELIFERLSLLEFVVFRSICKVWNEAADHFDSSRTYPLLMISERNEGKTRHFLSLTEHIQYKIKMLKFRRSVCVGCSHGWLVMTKGSNISLSNPFSDAHMDLPIWTRQDFFLSITMSSSPTSVGCVILANAGTCVVYCRPGDGEWTTVECDIHGEEGESVLLDMAIAFRGKFYALSGALSLVVIDVSSCRMTKLEVSGIDLPLIQTVKYTPYLVTSREDILLVLAVHKSTYRKTNNFKVFRLDLSNLVWVKMESLGDRVLFVGLDCSISMSGADVGSRGNHIYFTESSRIAWHVFNMEDGTVKPGPNLYPRSAFNCPRTVWIQPRLPK